MNCKFKEIFDRLTKLDKVEILKLNKTYGQHEEEYGVDDSDTIFELSEIIQPKALAYARDVIKKDGIPKDGEGWAFRPSILEDKDEDIEVMLCRTEDGRFKPSTCSPAWEAKGNSVDDSLGVKDPAEALAWGLTEAFAYYLAGDITHLRNGKHFPQNEIHIPTRRKAK
jgi:hypothetical protein